MISLPDDLPLIKYENGDVTAFRHDWLLRSILRAAEDAGYPQWWLAEHVAESVAAYLQLQFDENVLSIPRLEKAVQSVLQVIGYAEVSSRFTPDPPIQQIWLPLLAREAGSGFELSFFKLLEERLENALESGCRHIEILGLHDCVKSLRSRKQWTAQCAVTREEIVNFVRARVSASPDRGELLFSVL